MYSALVSASHNNTQLMRNVLFHFRVYCLVYIFIELACLFIIGCFFFLFN
jgi:hypothetical protein